MTIRPQEGFHCYISNLSHIRPRIVEAVIRQDGRYKARTMNNCQVKTQFNVSLF